MKSVRPSELVPIGKSMSTHGYRGALKLFVEDAYLESLADARAVFFDIDGVVVPLVVERMDIHGSQPVLSFSSKKTEEEIRGYVNRQILLHPDDIGEIHEDDLHPWHGYSLYDQASTVLGKMLDLVQDEYQQIAYLERPDASEKQIPLPDEWILSVDDDQERIVLDLPAGLLDV